MLVRRAEPRDLDSILEIWHGGIESSLGGPPPAGEDYRGYFEGRIANQSDVAAYFVTEDADGEVLAWQSLSPFRSNPAVAGVMAELSAYARPESTGRATHSGLAATFAHADASPLVYVVAFIAMSNPAAMRLAMHFGMQHSATLPVSPKMPEHPELAYLVYPCGSRPRG